jgi:ABC-type phosphate transport system substrate-binding protein
MARSRYLFVVGLLMALDGLHAPLRAQNQESSAGAVAIVAHPSTRIANDNLTFDELRRIFRGERQFWPDGSRVTLLVRAPVTQERKLVLQKIYRMSEDEFRQYWIAKMFRAEVAAGPKIVYSSEMARELVTAIPGAIGFMPASSVGAGVKVIKIDNRLPSDPNYILR